MMTGTALRAGAWPAVAGVSGVAVVVGGCAAVFAAAATALLPVCFALLAAAAAFTLDEPASAVVDVTPTGPARRTAIRAAALLAPLAVGALVMLAAAMRGLALPWAAAGLALAGNVVLGFAVACVVRTRTGEPGAAAGTAVVLLLLAPGLVPEVTRWVRTFPAPGAGGPSADTVWWIVLAVCAVAIAISVGGRRLPRWMTRFSVIPPSAGMMVAVPPVAAGRLAGPADHVPAGRREARISAGIAAAVVLAGVAGVALTFVARAAFKGNDLAFNLAALAAAVAYATLGALVVRRAGSLIGWLMLAESTGLVFMTLAATYCLLGVTTFPGDLPAARQAGTIAESGFASVAFILVLMLLLFPAGTLPSRRWRPVAAAGIAATALATIGLILGPRLVQIPAPGGVSVTFANPFGTPRPTPGLIGTLDGLLAVSIPFLAASFVSLAVRYRTGSWLLRQQIKWLALTAAAFLASMLLLLFSTWTHQPSLNAAASAMSGVIPLFGIPAAISAAILKHHLYDIDRIISRTLSYAIVTGLLVGLYAGLVLLTTQVLSFSSPVAVAISALAAAALFNPLRNRVQRAADRKFNRARYDSDRTVTAFAAGLQGEVDIGAVRADLLGTVNRTLEPVQLSLWLSSGPDAGVRAGQQRDPQIGGPGSVRGALMNATAQQTEPNTHEMVVIHRIFRREFPLLAGIVPRASDGDAQRAAHIARHIEFCLDGLHNHHIAEDEYLWPALLERARPHAELVRRMELQHEAVARHSEQARQLTGRWQVTPVPQAGTELAATLSVLGDALAEHLDEEEVSILPLVREHITVAEWENLGRRSFEKFPPSARLVAMGQVFEDGTPEDRALFLGKAPAPARMMWHLGGRRKYERYIGRVREAGR